MQKKWKASSHVPVSSLFQESQVICFSGVNREQIWDVHPILPSLLWDFLLLWHINVVWTGQTVSEHMLVGVLIWPFISQKVALMRSSERKAAEKRCFYFLTNQACYLIMVYNKKKVIKTAVDFTQEHQFFASAQKLQSHSFSLCVSLSSLRPMGSWALGVPCFRTIGGMSSLFCSSNRASGEEVASARSVHPQPQAFSSNPCL